MIKTVLSVALVAVTALALTGCGFKAVDVAVTGVQNLPDNDN